MDVNRHPPVIQKTSDTQVFTSTIFLLLTKCPNKVIMDGFQTGMMIKYFTTW